MATSHISAGALTEEQTRVPRRTAELAEPGSTPPLLLVALQRSYPVALDGVKRHMNVRRELADDDRRHGTYGAYTNLGCRCDRCRDANRRRRNAYMASVRAEGRIIGSHGRPLAYESGCRCQECRAAGKAKGLNRTRQ